MVLCITPQYLNSKCINLRKVEKRATLRAEWTSGDTTERFFGYVLKRKIKE
jgi:hypothetical protein